MPDRRQLHVRPPGARRAVVVGAGSFGTAVAVLLARGGLRTTLQARTAEQARAADRRPREPRLPAGRRAAGRPAHRDDRRRAGARRPRVPRRPLPRPGRRHRRAARRPGSPTRAAVVSLAKGLVPPDGTAPTIMLGERLGAARVACLGGPAHAREMVHEGAGLVAASASEELAGAIAPGLHARGRRLRALERPGRRRAGGRGQERRRAGLRRHRGAGPQRRGRRRRPHLRRGLALRRGARRAAGVAHRPGRHGRPRGDRARAAEPQPAGGRAAGRRRRRPRRSPARIGQAVEALE